MKRIAGIICILVLSVALTTCGRRSDVEKKDDTYVLQLDKEEFLSVSALPVNKGEMFCGYTKLVHKSGKTLSVMETYIFREYKRGKIVLEKQFTKGALGGAGGQMPDMPGRVEVFARGAFRRAGVLEVRGIRIKIRVVGGEKILAQIL